MAFIRTLEVREVELDIAPVEPGRRRRGRLLPFSPWHLMLMPLALLFALPLVQMVMTSFMTDAEINSFPPRFIPSSISFDG